MGLPVVVQIFCSTDWFPRHDLRFWQMVAWSRSGQLCSSIVIPKGAFCGSTVGQFLLLLLAKQWCVITLCIQVDY